MNRKLISFDWAIKKILRSKANFAILEGFLSELLFDDIEILEVLESESNKDSQDAKLNRLDIKVRNSRNELILIEIQYSSELDYLQRILYASSRAIAEHLKEGAAYAQVTKVISISILYFDFGDGDDYIYKGTTSFVGMHNKIKLELNEKQKTLYKAEKVENIYPEYYLMKVGNFDDIAKNTLDEWVYFLKNEDIKDNFKAKGLNKAKETLDFLKMSEEEKRKYNAFKEDRHHQASLYESTYVIGEMMGQKKEAERRNRELVDKMVSLGMDIEVVAEVTGLSREEVENMIESNNDSAS